MVLSYREEIAKLEALVAANPEGRVFTHLAEAYRRAGELDRARDVLEQGVRRHRDYSSAYVVLGKVRWDQGELSGAMAAFRRVLELDPHNLVALRSLGDLAERAGRPEEALEHYRQLLALDPADEELRRRSADLEQQLPRAPEPPGGTAPPAATGDWRSPAELSLDPVDLPGGPAVFSLAPIDLNSETLFGGEGDLRLPPSADTPEEEASMESDSDLGGTGNAEPRPEDVPSVEERIEHPFAPSASSETEWGKPPEQPDWGSPPAEADWRLGAMEEPEAEPAPVLTETMADVYAAQGLFEHAADILRELLRTRTGDPRLEQKLAEVEAKGAGAGQRSDVAAQSGGEAAAETRDPDRSLERDPWEAEWSTESELGVGSAASPYGRDEADTFGDNEEGTEPFPGAEGEPAGAEAEFGFRAQADAESDPMSSVEAAWTGRAGAGAAGPTPFAWAEEAESAEERREEIGILAYLRGLAAWRRGGAESAAADSAAPIASVGAPQEGDTAVSGQAEASATPLPFVYQPTAEGDILDELFGDISDEENAAAALQQERGPAPTAEAVDHPDPDAAPDQPAEPSPDDDLAEDDDLDTFRAWLQSLKG